MTIIKSHPSPAADERLLACSSKTGKLVQVETFNGAWGWMSTRGDEMAEACRRCDGCAESSHHWLDNPRFGDGTPHGDPMFVCKHCDETGTECPSCGGDGVYVEGDDEMCEGCDGEGVILCTGHEQFN